MFGRMGNLEIIVILIVVLLIFGPTQLPKLAKMFGKTFKSFKEGLDESQKDNDESNS